MSVLRGHHESGFFEGRGVRLPLAGRVAEEGLFVGIRPEDVEVADQPSPGRLPASVTLREPAGDRVLLTLRLGEESVRALTAPRDWPEAVFVHVPPEKLHLFSAATERRLEPGRT